eukprot:208531_1
MSASASISQYTNPSTFRYDDHSIGNHINDPFKLTPRMRQKRQQITIHENLDVNVHSKPHIVDSPNTPITDRSELEMDLEMDMEYEQFIQQNKQIHDQQTNDG